MIRKMKSQHGSQFKGIDDVLTRILSMLEVLSQDNEAYRDTIEVTRVPLCRWLPIDSFEGMLDLFKVTSIKTLHVHLLKHYMVTYKLWTQLEHVAGHHMDTFPKYFSGGQ